jgi:dynein heavy chain 1
MVGPTGCGKSQSWRVLLETMERTDGIKGESYIIDPKAISKDELYGKLDSTTAEWTDGVFTQILRRVIDNHRGESAKRHWIIFDGDVDPEWAENLNSVLDDNKLLTLPSGERLQIPDNVRIMFEVETLKYATLATVSRCGMVWFSDDTVTIDMIYAHYLQRLKQDDYDALGEDPSEKQKQMEQQQSQDGGQSAPQPSFGALN